eukprot:1695013-Amphidinium_carterae.3
MPTKQAVDEKLRTARERGELGPPDNLNERVPLRADVSSASRRKCPGSIGQQRLNERIIQSHLHLPGDREGLEDISPTLRLEPAKEQPPRDIEDVSTGTSDRAEPARGGCRSTLASGPNFSLGGVDGHAYVREVALNPIARAIEVRHGGGGQIKVIRIEGKLAARKILLEGVRKWSKEYVKEAHTQGIPLRQAPAWFEGRS